MAANATIERTLSMIKPDAVAKNVIGKIYSRFETNGLPPVPGAPFAEPCRNDDGTFNAAAPLRTYKGADIQLDKQLPVGGGLGGGFLLPYLMLAALSLLIGYLNFRSGWRRVLVLALCGPLTYLGNLARIGSIVLAAHWGGEAWGLRAHEIMGYGVFVIVLGGVLGAVELLRRWWPEECNPIGYTVVQRARARAMQPATAMAPASCGEPSRAGQPKRRPSVSGDDRRGRRRPFADLPAMNRITGT